MSAYEYTGYDSGGRRLRGFAEARDVKEARERLAARGILAERIRAVGGEAAAGRFYRRGRAAANERVRLYEELASMLGAGIPMVEAFGILMETPGAGISGQTLARLRDAVRDGETLAGALPAVFGNLPSFEAAVIEAGQRAGAMAVTLERLAGFLEARHVFGEKVRAAMVYPLFVAGFAIFMTLGIVGFGLPALGNLLAEAAVPLPAIISWSVRWGRFTAVAVVLSGCAAGLALRLSGARAGSDPRRRKRIERALFRIPLAGDGFTLLVNLRFVRTLALLVGGGHPLVESLPLAANASGSVWVAENMCAAAERLRHGDCTPAEAVALSAPLAAVGTPAWIRSGETSGTIDKMLARLADRLERRWEIFSARALNYLMPAVILSAGSIVLAATLSILLPVLNLNRTILQ